MVSLLPKSSLNLSSFFLIFSVMFTKTSAITAGLSFGQIAVAVLGTLVITGEYASGQIRSSLAAVPRRGQLLAAKAQ